MLSVCQVMVDSIKERIINLDESSGTDCLMLMHICHCRSVPAGHSSSSFSSKQLVSCFATLDLFCKIKPSLLLPHATTLHPYLSSQCSVSNTLTHTHTHTLSHSHAHTLTHSYTHSHIHTHSHTYTHTHTHTNTHTHTHTRTH